MTHGRRSGIRPSLPDPDNWHQRFLLQAAWTRAIRQYLFQGLEMQPTTRVLEVGCGTGAILSEDMPGISQNRYGVDIKHNYLTYAQNHMTNSTLVEADGHKLPFTKKYFDIVYCHFLLMWVEDPHTVLCEMVRVTRPGGAVMALAEPDYGGRIDYPPELESLGLLQSDALRMQGADPRIGRRLASLFSSAGIQTIEMGILGGQWTGQIDLAEWESEWVMLASDLANLISNEQLQQYQDIDAQAWQFGHRVLYVPTFYIWGRIPG